MRELFKNKRIVFFGDSITQNGGFCYNIRSYFRDNNIKSSVFNRGVGGTRAVMAKYMMEEEVFPLNPDVVFVSYGVNDIGIWLYDSLKPITPELLEKRRIRDEEHFASMKFVLTKLKEKGITPICQTPYAVDELLVEKEDIETIADNKEKEDYIGPSFYKRKTFENINEGLKYYAETMKKICAELGVEVLDTFTFTRELSHKEEGIFKDDGTHYTEKGHYYIAKHMLEFMGVNEDIKEFKQYPDMDEAKELEHVIREVMGSRRSTMLPESIWPKTTHEDILNFYRKKENDKEYWNYANVKLILDNYEKKDELIQKEIDIMTSF